MDRPETSHPAWPPKVPRRRAVVSNQGATGSTADSPTASSAATGAGPPNLPRRKGIGEHGGVRIPLPYPDPPDPCRQLRNKRSLLRRSPSHQGHLPVVSRDGSTRRGPLTKTCSCMFLRLPTYGAPSRTKGQGLPFPLSRPSLMENQACQRRSAPSNPPLPPWQNTSRKQTVQGLPNLDTGTTPRLDIQTYQPASAHHRQARQKPNNKHPYRARPTSTQAPSMRRKEMGVKEAAEGRDSTGSGPGEPRQEIDVVGHVPTRPSLPQ